MRPISILGVPTDFGANRRGVDMGPSAIRYGGLYEALDAAGVDWTDDGDLRTPRTAIAGERLASRDGTTTRHREETAEVCSRLADRISSTVDEGRMPLVLGGDHSVAIGTIAGSAAEDSLGALWFDAHADFNTPETSPSGNIHGMPLASVLGYGSLGGEPWTQAPALDESRVALVGLRDVDDSEQPALEDSDVSVYTMTDIDRRGIGTVVTEAIDVATDGDGEVHVSLDLDWLDPNEAPGVGTPVRGGVSYREAHTAMEYVAELVPASSIRSMEVVEVNPVLDRENETGTLACELIASAVGKTVL